MRNAEASFPTTFSPRPRKKSTIDVRGGHVYRLPNAVYRSSVSPTNQYLPGPSDTARTVYIVYTVYTVYIVYADFRRYHLHDKRSGRRPSDPQSRSRRRPMARLGPPLPGIGDLYHSAILCFEKRDRPHDRQYNSTRYAFISLRSRIRRSSRHSLCRAGADRI